MHSFPWQYKLVWYCFVVWLSYHPIHSGSIPSRIYHDIEISLRPLIHFDDNCRWILDERLDLVPCIEIHWYWSLTNSVHWRIVVSPSCENIPQCAVLIEMQWVCICENTMARWNNCWPMPLFDWPGNESEAQYELIARNYVWSCLLLYRRGWNIFVGWVVMSSLPVSIYLPMLSNPSLHLFRALVHLDRNNRCYCYSNLEGCNWNFFDWNGKCIDRKRIVRWRMAPISRRCCLTLSSS